MSEMIVSEHSAVFFAARSSRRMARIEFPSPQGRGSNVTLSNDVKLKFASLQDAQICVLRTISDGLMIDARGCRSGLQLIFPLDSMGIELPSVLRLGGQWDLLARIRYRASPAARIERVSLVEGSVNGPYKTWRSIKDDIDLSNGDHQQWRAASPGEKSKWDTSFVMLALDLAAGAAPITLNSVEVLPDSLRSARGRLIVKDKALSGWMHADYQSQAMVQLTRADGAVISSALLNLAREEEGKKSFKLDLADLLQNLQGAVGEGVYYATLHAGSVQLARSVVIGKDINTVLSRRIITPPASLSALGASKQNPSSASATSNSRLGSAPKKTEAFAPSPVRQGRDPDLLDLARGAITALRHKHPTPYYDRLLECLEGGISSTTLASICQTVLTIDLPRQGQLPKPGPLVSVIMPTYNRASIIASTIASLQAQSYSNFELIITDDASDDDTRQIVDALKDSRIKLFRQDARKGAAAARNRSLKAATGEIIAYLDSDNLWHPRYLELMVEELVTSPGHLAGYAGFFDLTIAVNGRASIRKCVNRHFHLEDQLDLPFVDLNSFVHRRALTDLLGGFDEHLVRRQDYDLISRYCWSREPARIPFAMNLYQRLDGVEQITTAHRGDVSAKARISDKVAGYYDNGLSASFPDWLKKLTIVSWDRSRNHFAKAYSVADALSRRMEVELVSFTFFEPEFEPLSGQKPSFKCTYLEGGRFPDFFGNFSDALNAITGDAIYAVKPRLTSMGLALLSNYHTGKPILLEANDLETVVSSPKGDDRHGIRPLEDVLDDLDAAQSPYADIWSQVLDPLVTQLPALFTHNVNLYRHYDRKCLYMRNIKDELVYAPESFSRDHERRALGYGPDDRVILFGGLVRKHKGVFQLLSLLERLNDRRYKLLIVGNRETPDLRSVMGRKADNVRFLPPQPPQRMAALNLAADAVILWLDPSVAASHYQSPYKMSDALAMGPLIIGSAVSDLADFADRGLMLNVPYGDIEGLATTLVRALDDKESDGRRRARARQFFAREFSYRAVPGNVALGASRIVRDHTYDVSIRFAEFFSEFERRISASGSK